ncbi:MAG: hypothetical protein MJZ79_07665 [Paludibacteraceae bacterium]|nr:hypothetical protein [Paludibacteraceae bacterium]
MIEDKSIFSREKIHDINMRVVIVRLDFAGINDLNDLVKTFEKNFPKAFKHKCVMENREVNVSFREKDFESISKSLSLPIETIKSERFVRYEGIEGCMCDVSFDISQFYLCLTIKCHDNYDGLMSYVAPMKGAIKLFKEKFHYFVPKRLGIRKVRVQTKDIMHEFNEVFEPFVFGFPTFGLDNPISRKSEYFDILEDRANNLCFNIRREIGYVQNKDGENKYSTTLDIDAYYHEQALQNGKVNEMLTYANQMEFDIYKECMKFKYLSQISH